MDTNNRRFSKRPFYYKNILEFNITLNVLQADNNEMKLFIYLTKKNSLSSLGVLTVSWFDI